MDGKIRWNEELRYVLKAFKAIVEDDESKEGDKNMNDDDLWTMPELEELSTFFEFYDSDLF